MDNPTDVKAFESLQNALLEEGRLPELKEVYEQVFPAVQDKPERDRILRAVDQKARTHPDDGIKHWLNAQLGLLFWKQLENPDRAEVYFRRVQAAAGQSGMVAEFYTEFYARRENWRRLEQLYTAQGMPEIEVKTRLAEVADERGKSDKALAFWQQVYNLEPTNDEVYDRLKQLFTEVGKWHSLIELLKTRLKASKGNVDACVDVHVQMIEVYQDHIKSDTKVIAEWQAILKLQPSNLAAMDALQEVYSRMKRWPDLVRVLQSRIEHIDSDAERLSLHAEIAELMLDRFSNSSEAIKHYGEILEIDPENLAALGKLKELYEQRKAWEPFIEVSQKEISLTATNDEARAVALIELAALASERIRHPRIAMSLWEEIRSNDPNNLDALNQLQELYERDKQYDKLVEVLEQLVDKAGTDAERIALLEKLGQVTGTRLKDDERTARVWKRVLEIDPSHRRAFNDMRKRALSAHDWESLEWLFRNFGTVADLIRAFESQLKNLSEEEKVPLYQRIAALWQDEGQTAKAVKAYEGILAIDDSHTGASKALIPIYTELGRWDDLPQVYDVVLDSTVPIEERQALLVDKAAVHEQHQDDLESAFFCYVQAYQEDHQSASVRAEFDRLAASSENWEVYVSVLEQIISLLQDKAEITDTTLRAAEVRHQRLGEHDEALALYRKVLDELDEGNARALDATEAIYRETEQWHELIDVLEDKLASGDLDSDTRKALRFEIGAVFRDRLGEAGAAMGVYREMMDDFPSDVRIYDELANLHMQASEWDELSGVLQRKLSSLADRRDAEPADLADLQCKLGMLAYSQHGNVARSVQHYVDALAADASCDLAVRSLVELLASESHREQIALSLEPVYAARDAHAELADVLEIQLNTASGKKARTGLLDRLLKLYRGPLDNNERALWAASRLFALTPEKKALRTTLEELSEQLEEWQHLADLYETQLDSVKKAKVKLEVMLVIARTAHHYLEDGERAERVYRQVLEQEPEHAETLDALEDLYLETDEPEKLLEVLRKKEGLADSDETVIDNRFQTAAILADQLDRVDDAIDDMRFVLGLSPDHPMALARLDDLFEKTLAWEDLHDVLQSRVRLAGTDEERASLLFRLGRLREGQLESVSAAIDTYAQILAIDVTQADAVGALERLFASEDHATTIAPLLEPTYQHTDDWRGLVRVYEVLESASDEPGEKVDYHYRMAKLYEHQGTQADRAFAHYGHAYRLIPEREETMAQLLRLAVALENYAELTTLLREQVEEVGDPDRRREIHRVIASTLANDVGDRDGAIAHYRSVLDISSDDLPAVDALIDQYRVAEDWAHLVEMLRHKAPLMEIDELRKELLLEAGGIAWANMENAAEAIGVFEEVLGIDADDAQALDALADLYQETEEFTELCRILGRKVERAQDLDEKKELAGELAGVQEVHLEDLDAAIDTHRMILSWDELDLGELNALDELYLRTERWIELIEILDREIAQLEPEGQKELLLRKADIYRDKQEDTIEAVNVLAEILGEDPMERRAIDRLESIVLSDDQRELAFEVLEAFLEIGEEWARIYDLLDKLVEFRDNPIERIAGLHKMGGLAEENLKDAERAFGCYGRGLQEDLNHEESMAQVERLAAEGGLWEQLTLLLSDSATSADDPQRALQLRLRAAEVFKAEMGDMDRAIATYRAVLEEHTENGVALGALDELYRVTERWPDLAGVLSTEIDVAVDTDEKVALYFRLADVAERQLDDTDRTFECYSEVFYMEPHNADAIENLERLARAGIHRGEIAGLLEPGYVERQQWDKLHEMLELRLEDAADDDDKLDLMRRLADLNLTHLEKKADALHWYGQAFRLDPLDDGLLSQMELLAGETDEWQRFNEVIQAVPYRLEDSDRKIMLWHRGAAVLEEQLLQVGQAEQIYELILNEDPDSPDLKALQALDRIYLSQERWEDLQRALQWEVAAAEFDDDTIKLLLRLGALQRDRLEAPGDAIDSFQQVLEMHDTQADALAALANLYREAEQWEPLSRVLRSQVDVAESDEVRLRNLRELADVAENRLDKAADAIELWDEVTTYAHEDTDAIRNLQRLQRSAGNWEAVVENVERELRVLGSSEPGRSSDLYRELGHLWAAELEDPLNSQTAWENLLKIQENDIEALQALETIHEEAYNHDALAQVLQKMVESLRFAGPELLALYQKLARLWSDALPDSGQAIWAWEKVRETEPENLEAVEALERLFNDEARWTEAVAIMQVKAGLLDDAAAIAVWMNLGEVQQFQLSDWEAAAGSYKTVLGIESGHDDAGDRLESIYSEHEQWFDLSELLTERVEMLEELEDKRDLLVRLAELHESRLDDKSTALVFLQASQMQLPADLDVLSSLERLAGETEQWAELVEPFELALEALEDAEDKIDVGMRFARLLRDRVADNDKAIAQFRAVLTHDEEHEGSLRELAALLESTGAWAPLVEVLEKRFEIAAVGYDRAEIGLKIGAVLRDELSNVDGSIDAFRRVLNTGEADARSIDALEAIFQSDKRWTDLIEVLETKAGNGLGDETAIRLEIGRIRERELDDAEGAIGVYEDILGFDDTNRAALDRLLELYAGIDNMEKLTSVYERLLDTAQSNEDQIQYCEALALLHQQVHDNAEAAADYFHRVLMIDESHQDALNALEEIYADLEQWEDLIDIFRRRLEQSADNLGQWTDYKLRAADVYRHKLADPDNAIYAYQELLERNEGHGQSLDALEELFTETEQAEQLQEILAKKAAAATDNDARISLMCRRARIVMDELSDTDGALDILVAALDLEPGHDEALVLQEQVYSSREEWENVVDVLRRRDLYAQADADKAEVQLRIADVYRDKIQDGPRALEHYERAMQLVPDSIEVAERLSQLYVIAGDWVRAEPLLSRIVDKLTAQGAPAERRAELHYNLGLALQACLRREEALAQFQIALELAPGDVDVLKALGKLAYETNDYERAETIYSQLVAELSEDAEDDVLVELYRTLGQVAFRSGNSEKALDYLQKTVELQPGSTEALVSLIELCEEQEYWRGVVDYAAELRDLKTDTLEQFELQLKIGDAWLNNLDNKDEAVSAYSAALDYQPESKAAHFKIFQVLLAAEQFEEAVEILNRLVELESEPKTKSKYLGAIGDIFREKLEDGERAVEFYNRALDEDPSLLKLFRFIDEILTRAKNWKDLRANYRSMLKRVDGDESKAQLQYQLAFNLGEIYRTRVKQLEKAAAWFEFAREVKPKDKKTLAILSELYEVQEDWTAAIEAERELLKLEPNKIDHYRTLKRLFFDAGRRDAAWVACAVIKLLEQANERELTFYEEHATPEMADAQTPRADIWGSSLLSEHEDRLIGDIFWVIYQGIGPSLAPNTPKDLGFKKKQRVDPKQRELFTHVFGSVTRVLGINPAPDVYHSSAQAGLIIRNTAPPIIVIGDDLRQGKTEQELSFVLAKALTYFHPLHVATMLVSPETLDVLFKAAVKMYVADFDTGGLEKHESFVAIIEALNDMPPQLRESLRGLVAKFIARGNKPNLTRWLNQIELSANHAALLVCNDPVAAGRFIKAETSRPLFTAPGRTSTRDKLVDMALYALSDKYLELRESLGLQIETD